MIILITLISIISIAAAIRIVISKRKKAHLISLEFDLEQFRMAAKRNIIDNILEYGDRLIWNEHLTTAILQEIRDVVDKQISTDPKLEELKLNIYNRQLRFDRINPDSWGIVGS